MFAIVEIQGKQFKVAVGDVLSVEHIDAKEGDMLSFDRVFLTSDGKKTTIGTPTVAGMVVKAKVVAQEKGEKIDVLRYKHKVRYRKHTGLRPQLTKLEIVSLS